MNSISPDTLIIPVNNRKESNLSSKKQRERVYLSAFLLLQQKSAKTKNRFRGSINKKIVKIPIINQRVFLLMDKEIQYQTKYQPHSIFKVPLKHKNQFQVYLICCDGQKIVKKPFEQGLQMSSAVGIQIQGFYQDQMEDTSKLLTSCSQKLKKFNRELLHLSLIKNNLYIIPSEIKHFTSMKVLNLKQNKLKEFPQIWDFNSLTEIDVSLNNLCNTVEFPSRFWINVYGPYLLPKNIEIINISKNQKIKKLVFPDQVIWKNFKEFNAENCNIQDIQMRVCLVEPDHPKIKLKGNKLSEKTLQSFALYDLQNFEMDDKSSKRVLEIRQEIQKDDEKYYL